MNSTSKNNEERIVPLRLQKFLARAGVASRRGSENLMSAGRVCVNGEVVTELGSKVDPLVDVVTVDGKEVAYPNTPTTIMLNKPKGVITTMSDPFGRPCVASLVPTDRYPGLFPIGRLDTDTTGLLLFTTDGELGNRLMHPRHHVTKTYEATLEGKVDDKVLEPLRTGIELEDGMTLPASVSIIVQGSRQSRVEISIREGRKRQVRRMFDAVGHPVIHLHRKSVGPLELENVKPGEWRELSDSECASLTGNEEQ